jgi:hypothetical protein
MTPATIGMRRSQKLRKPASYGLPQGGTDHATEVQADGARLHHSQAIEAAALRLAIRDPGSDIQASTGSSVTARKEQTGQGNKTLTNPCRAQHQPPTHQSSGVFFYVIHLRWSRAITAVGGIPPSLIKYKWRDESGTCE